MLLINISIDNNSSNKVSNKVVGKWISLNSYEEVVELKKSIVYNNLINASAQLKDKETDELVEDADYIYDDVTKKMYLAHRSNEVSEYTINQTKQALNEAEVLEKRFNKSVREFKEQDVYEFIDYIFDRAYYHKTERFLSIISGYQSFAKENINEKIYWDIDRVSLVDYISSKSTSSNVISRRNINDMFDTSISPQKIAPVLFIFEGVLYKDDKYDDELRYLKNKDLSSNSLTIRNDSDQVKRVIDIDKQTYNMLQDVVNQTHEIVNRYGDDYPAKIEDSEHMLRRVLSNNSNSSGAMGYRAIYSRIRDAKETGKYITDVNINPRSIRNSGMLYYMSKFMLEGYDKDEAAELVIKRFGDFETEDENSESINAQRIRRLKLKFKTFIQK